MLDSCRPSGRGRRGLLLWEFMRLVFQQGPALTAFTDVAKSSHPKSTRRTTSRSRVSLVRELAGGRLLRSTQQYHEMEASGGPFLSGVKSDGCHVSCRVVRFQCLWTHCVAESQEVPLCPGSGPSKHPPGAFTGASCCFGCDPPVTEPKTGNPAGVQFS